MADAAIGMHLYVPKGRPFFCAEPVTHAPDSFRANASTDVLAPAQA